MRSPTADLPTFARTTPDVASDSSRPSRLGPLRDMLNAPEWFRYFTDRFVLIPAARVLPLRAALMLAEFAGVADLLMPTAARRTAIRDMRSATGLEGRALLRLAARRRAALRRSLVYTARAAVGRDSLADWEINETGTDAVHRMVAERRPFILAGIHSTSPSFLRMKLLDGGDTFSIRADPRWHLSPFILRTRLRTQMHARTRARLRGLSFSRYMKMHEPQRLTLVPNFWRRDANWKQVPARTPRLQDDLLAKLARPGAAVSIAVDAYWDKPNAHRRYFVGTAPRGFALGAARIARLAQCPVIPYITALGDAPRTAYIECGPPIAPPAADDKSADTRTLDQVLDWHEAAIARHPAGYADLIGDARRWDAVAERWVESASARNPRRSPANAIPERGAACGYPCDAIEGVRGRTDTPTGSGAGHAQSR